MVDLILGVDPSSSLSKGFYTGIPFQLQLSLMEPELAQVKASSIETYEKNLLGSASIDDSAWIAVDGDYYAIGFLAQKFYGTLGLKQVKYQRALYKVLAMVGTIAQTKKLPTRFKLSLGLLLPYSEYRDRDRFHQIVKKALAKYSFRGTEYNVELVNFLCLPEGAGLLLRASEQGEISKAQTVLVIMIGYRNASFLLVERGQIKQGWTTPLGFIGMIEPIKSMTSALEEKSLTAAICRAGSRVKSGELSPLVRSAGTELQKQELSEIVNAVKLARGEYWQMLVNYINTEIPNLTAIDQVILGGGTAHYWRSELDRFFAKKKVNWCSHLESRIHKFLGERWEKESLQYRLTDSYAFFFYLMSITKSKSITKSNSGAAA